MAEEKSVKMSIAETQLHILMAIVEDIRAVRVRGVVIPHHLHQKHVLSQDVVRVEQQEVFIAIAICV